VSTFAIPVVEEYSTKKKFTKGLAIEELVESSVENEGRFRLYGKDCLKLWKVVAL